MQPPGSQMGSLAKQSFKSKGIKLPMDWSQPSHDHYPRAFADGEHSTAEDPARVFGASSSNKYHTDAAKTVGKALEDYIDGITGAICTAIGQWMNACAFAGVVIAGPVGTVAPGCCQGPPLMGLIMGAGPPMNTPQEMKYSNAVAGALGTAWQGWHLGLAGTLQYPAFAAFPGPVGAPMPNVPLPVAAFGSPGEAALSKAALSGSMLGQYGNAGDQHASDLFDAIADGFFQVFGTWKGATQVMNVIGTGPIPTFAPPYVPVGPVVGGVGSGSACMV